MSDELILDVSFDSQTVTDATENWTLSGTPNVTYEQISGGSGYSLVTGKSGTPPTLVAVDQEAIYNEYTIDFNLYVKPSYTDAGWFSFFNLNTGVHYTGDYKARVYNGLMINLEVGSSTDAMVTIDSPTGRWIHITIISEYDSDTRAYTAYLYVDSVLRTYKQGTRQNGSPFAIGEKLVLFNRGGSTFYLPNTPGLAIDKLTVIAGIHVPNQTPAISLPNLSRVFNNFCTWLSSQLSAVAKSGSYNDLSDKPTISTVNDGTLTIQQNGTNVQTFTANASTNKTANIQCVDLSTAQTIGGAKTFYTSATTYPIIKLRTAFIEQGLYDSDNLRGVAFRCADKNDAILGDFGYKTERTGEVGSYFSARTKVNNTQTTREVKLRFKPGSTDCELVPDTTNLIDLGTSTNKWKSINGLNPGALSLPGTGVIDISSNITVLDGTTANKFTPQVNGWLHINGTGTDASIYAIQGRVGMKSTGNQASSRCAVLVPVVAGAEVAVTCKLSTLTWANITPCQGNV